MAGKIFDTSSNVFEDQARILFDYYRAAAGQIVAEEMRVEQEESSARESLAQAEAGAAKLPGQRTLFFAAAGVLATGALGLLVLGTHDIAPLGIVAGLAAAGPAVMGFLRHQAMGNAERHKTEIAQAIERCRNAHAAIRREYKVHKLGVAYVPVARVIPFEGKSFQIDLTGSIAPQEFKLSVVRRSDLFTRAVGDLEAMITEAPLVEGSSEMEEVDTDQYSRSIQKVTYYDYLGRVDRALRSVAFCLEDLDTTSVSLPVIAPGSEMASFLDRHAAEVVVKNPVMNVFDEHRFDAQLESFRLLNEMKKSLESRSTDFEAALRRLIVNMAEAIQTITALKVASANKLLDWSNRVLFAMLKAPYNHYSPSLEAEEIDRIRLETFNYQESVESYKPFQLKQSSRVLFDLSAGNWVAEDGSRTTTPFGLSQLQEEIIAPIVQSLMAETRIERLKIYNAIRDQKIDYLNQWHRDTEDFYGRNRAESADLINMMRSTFTEFVSNYNAMSALEKTNSAMVSGGSAAATGTLDGDATETLAAYDVKSREFQAVQEDFADYMERLKEDIDARASKFSYIEYYDASLRDSAAKSVAEAETAAQNLDPRRKALVAVNPLFAVASKLPPPPVVEQEALDALAMNLPAAARNILTDIDSRAAVVA
jgi:hypothetical protein